MPRPSAALHRRLLSEEMLLPPGVTPPGSRGVILGAALRLFAERGYGGTSVRDIAKATGIQPATMYSHYPSKEHVLSELIKIGHEEHHRRLRVALQDAGTDPRLQLAALVRAHVRTHADYPMLTVAANSELHALSPKFAAPTLELRRQSEQLFADVIQRGVKSRVFKTPDAWLAMAAIAAMGLRVANWYTPAFDKSADDVAGIYAEFALRMLGAK
jgi:AcrR family transcriptional regulator